MRDLVMFALGVIALPSASLMWMAADAWLDRAERRGAWYVWLWMTAKRGGVAPLWSYQRHRDIAPRWLLWREDAANGVAVSWLAPRRWLALGRRSAP